MHFVISPFCGRFESGAETCIGEKTVVRRDVQAITDGLEKEV